MSKIKELEPEYMKRIKFMKDRVVHTKPEMDLENAKYPPKGSVIWQNVMQRKQKNWQQGRKTKKEKRSF